MKELILKILNEMCVEREALSKIILEDDFEELSDEIINLISVYRKGWNRIGESYLNNKVPKELWDKHLESPDKSLEDIVYETNLNSLNFFEVLELKDLK